MVICKTLKNTNYSVNNFSYQKNLKIGPLLHTEEVYRRGNIHDVIERGIFSEMGSIKTLSFINRVP